MTRPAAVDALFAGHTLPKSKAALDEVREYIKGLERYAGCAEALERIYGRLLMSERDGVAHITEEDGAMAESALRKARGEA